MNTMLEIHVYTVLLNYKQMRNHYFPDLWKKKQDAHFSDINWIS